MVRKGENKLESQKKEIIEMYLYTHFSIGLISKKFNCSYGPIKNILISNDIPLRTQSETKKLMFKEGRLKTTKLNLPEKEIIRLYKKLSGIEVAKKFKCNPQVIRRILKENNVSIRNISETKKLIFKEGRLVPWNKGKPFLAGEKNPMYGKVGVMKGKYHTEKAKRNISLKNKGKEITKEQRRKISETIIKEGLFKMEKNPSWKGGKSFEPYGILFNNKLKEQIRKRDNYTCQECKYTEEQLGRKLDIHHIDFNKQNNNPNNLISLCKSCHAQTQFNRENWTEYFKNKIKLEV